MEAGKPKISLKTEWVLLKSLFGRLHEFLPAYILLIALWIPVDVLIYRIFMPAATGRIIDMITKNKPDLFVFWLCILFVGIVIGLFVTFKLLLAFRNRAVKMTNRLKTLLFRHICRLPVSDFESTHTGDLVSRLTADINATSDIFRSRLPDVVSLVIQLVFGCIYIGFIAWPVLLIAIVIGLFMFAFHTTYAKYILKHSKDVQRFTGESNRLFSDLLAGAWVMRVYKLQQYTDGQSAEFFGRVRDSDMARVKKQMLRNLVLTGMDSVVVTVFTLVAMKLTGDGVISLPNMMVVSSLAIGIAYNINYAGDLWVNLQNSIAGAERVVEILDMPEEKIADENGESCDLSHPLALSLEELTFSYKSGPPVLSRLSVKLETGKTLAVVGRSGGGKSTLFKLLMGFYRYDSGKITVFGKDYESFDIDGLRKLMAYVPQENYLFNGTIRKNLLLGKPDATEEEIVKAAMAANAHDFISALEDGYDAVVGERGVMLSGGQRQRVAIARALLKDAPILLLDEATASLDTESEREVQLAIENLMSGRSTIIIAHRLATVENADNIIVLENGMVVESGSHSELLLKNRRYAWYYNLQFKQRGTDELVQTADS